MPPLSCWVLLPVCRTSMHWGQNWCTLLLNIFKINPARRNIIVLFFFKFQFKFLSTLTGVDNLLIETAQNCTDIFRKVRYIGIWINKPFPFYFLYFTLFLEHLERYLHFIYSFSNDFTFFISWIFTKLH